MGPRDADLLAVPAGTLCRCRRARSVGEEERDGGQQASCHVSGFESAFDWGRAASVAAVPES
jgi:hypothetical protein